MIEQLIDEKGLSLEAVAKDLGVDVTTVWRHTKGTTRPTIEVLRGYARVFNVEFENLLDHYYPPRDPSPLTSFAHGSGNP
jgi:transcriptional regulator with XRE-family HTH domain